MAVQRADTSTMEQSRWMADDYEVRITSATNGLDSGCGNGKNIPEIEAAVTASLNNNNNDNDGNDDDDDNENNAKF